MNHKFKTRKKMGPGRKHGQTKRVRQGASKPGGNGQGSTRRPF